MTDDEKLARWQGLDTHECDPHSFHCDNCARGSSQTPDYLNDDAAAMSLLDTLVEKGVYPALEWKEEWQCQIWKRVKVGSSHYEYDFVCEAAKPTRREAVVAAVLKLIGKEAL